MSRQVREKQRSVLVKRIVKLPVLVYACAIIIVVAGNLASMTSAYGALGRSEHGHARLGGRSSLLLSPPARSMLVSGGPLPAAPYSWDPGLYAEVSPHYSTVHAWGRRVTAGAWGTGPVNYQAGATTINRVPSSGSLSFLMQATYCPAGQCSYGAGTGYKALVQFWDNPTNYIAFGLIHDPGVSPVGTTIMVEGAANGVPVGGYWPPGAVSGTDHKITVTWNLHGIEFNMDGQVTLGYYPVLMDAPSVSFLGAARETGDICDVTFENIQFIQQSAVLPDGNPYFTYTDTVTENGSGSGYSAFINVHDAHSDAVSVGIQSDTTSPTSKGDPWFMWERVEGGNFSHSYIQPASHSPYQITLEWWASPVNEAVFSVNASPIAEFPMYLTPRLFFQVEGDGRQEGDSVNDTFGPVQISVGDSCPTYCGLNGSWNTAGMNFNTYGLQAIQTNGNPQNGASFAVRGTVTGLRIGQNWGNTMPMPWGIAMIAQYWNGQ